MRVRVVAGHAKGRQGERCLHTVLERRRAAPSGTCVVCCRGAAQDELMPDPLIVTHVAVMVLLCRSSANWKFARRWRSRSRWCCCTVSERRALRRRFGLTDRGGVACNGGEGGSAWLSDETAVISARSRWYVLDVRGTAFSRSICTASTSRGSAARTMSTISGFSRGRSAEGDKDR